MIKNQKLPGKKHKIFWIIFFLIFIFSNIFSGCAPYARRTDADMPSLDESRSLLNIFAESDSLIIRFNDSDTEIRFGDRSDIREITAQFNIEIMKPHEKISLDYTLIFVENKRILGSLWVDSKLLTWGIVGNDNELGRCNQNLVKIIDSRIKK
ncbi:hypothetical protein J7L68_05455 [bacterium]|nr:hypothetical protein [bacterium]